MKKHRLLVALFFSVFIKDSFAGLVQENGPYCEYNDVYCHLQEEILILPKNSQFMSNSLWEPIDFTQSASQEELNAVGKEIREWTGTTLILADSCVGFLTHYFHFLEHLIGVWQFGGCQNASDIRHIIFCCAEKKWFDWVGVNQINRKLIKALFPNADVHILYSLQQGKEGVIHFPKMLISSRFTSYKNPRCTQINKMLGASWQNIDLFTMEKLRQTVFSALGIAKEPCRNTPKITYVVRHPPRYLLPYVERKLLRDIRIKTGIPVRVANFANISFEEQLRIVANTDIFLSVHGNGLSHILFLPPSAAVVELFPSTGFFTWDYALLAKIRGIDYYGQTANGWVSKEEDPHASTFSLNSHNPNEPVEWVDIEPIIKIIESKVQK